jgi:thymidylate synthase
MNSLDKKYTELLTDILENGTQKEDRTGTGTISVFGRQFRHKMSEGFPLLTTKKMYFKGVIHELLWFLQGRTDLRYLLENDCHIWTGDAYKVYDKDFDREHPAFSAPYPKRLTVEEFEKKIIEDDEFNKWYGDLGPIYGKQWRAFGGYDKVPNGWNHGSISSFKDVAKSDQIANLINDLKSNPDSRRLIVTAWNPAELDQMTLPPCHYGFQVYTRELSLRERVDIFNLKMIKEGIRTQIATVGVVESYWKKSLEETKHNIPKRAISLMWNQRSVDTFLGLPFNIASYGLLLEIIAKAVNMVPDELIGNLGDTHLYSNHIEQAKEQIGRELTIKERLDLASKKYKVFDPFDFHRVDHEEIDELYPVERRTREPYTLPTLNHMKTGDFYKSLSEDLSLITHLNASDFVLENYKSHPAIKAPLSN